MFLYFCDKNKALFCNGRKRINDSTLVALTIMIAVSRAEEKEMMVSVIRAKMTKQMTTSPPLVMKPVK